MSEPTSARDLTFSLHGDKLDTIRGTKVPDGTMVVPGVGYVVPKGREVTARAPLMS